MPTAAVNGAHLYYTLTGDGPPLVLVHGAWGDHRAWESVVPAFATRFRVLTYDRRGHSRSVHPPGRDSIDEDVADLAALIEALGLVPAHVAGFSFGGAVALRLAMHRPDLVRTAAVHEPPLFALLADDPRYGPAVQAERDRLEAVVARLATGDAEGGTRQFFDTFFPDAWDAMATDVQRDYFANAQTFVGEIRDTEMFTIDPAVLAACSRSALLSAGGESPAYWPALIGALGARLPHAEVLRIPGAGHVPLDAPEYTAAVMAFAEAHH